MKIQKKHIVMTSLVLALATAVYINYQISQARTTSPAKELGGSVICKMQTVGGNSNLRRGGSYNGTIERAAGFLCIRTH